MSTGYNHEVLSYSEHFHSLPILPHIKAQNYTLSTDIQTRWLSSVSTRSSQISAGMSHATLPLWQTTLGLSLKPTPAACQTHRAFRADLNSTAIHLHHAPQDLLVTIWYVCPHQHQILGRLKRRKQPTCFTSFGHSRRFTNITSFAIVPLASDNNGTSMLSLIAARRLLHFLCSYSGAMACVALANKHPRVTAHTQAVSSF